MPLRPDGRADGFLQWSVPLYQEDRILLEEVERERGGVRCDSMPSAAVLTGRKWLHAGMFETEWRFEGGDDVGVLRMLGSQLRSVCNLVDPPEFP